VAWGSDYYGQCTVPAPPANESYVEIAVGYWHSLARVSDGTVVAWGRNDHGQCSVPAPPAGESYVEIAGGAYHSLGRLSDGTVVTWGYDPAGLPAPPAGKSYVEIAAGWNFSLGRLSDGTIVGWGDGTSGQTTAPAPPVGESYVEIAAGWDFSLGRLSDGTVVAWGNNDYGQCNVPPPPPGESYVEISAGYGHSLGLLSDGIVVGWGRNNVGQLEVPGPPEGFAYSMIAAGRFQSLTLVREMTLSVPGHFPTIQGAIDFLEIGSSEVQMVLVAPGTYHENIDFKGLDITVRSDVDGDRATIDLSPETTFIDGGGTGSAVRFVSGEGVGCVFQGFTITNGHSLHGGGIRCESSSPKLSDLVITSNVADEYGGGMYSGGGAPTVTDCTFSGNSALYGAGMMNDSSSPTVEGCKFLSNSALVHGGGLENFLVSNATVTNCLFVGNSAVQGGGMMNLAGSLNLTNCTFSLNDASLGAGMNNAYSSAGVLVTNCIFWNDINGGEVFNDGTSSCSVAYSCVQGGYPGTGNIARNPRFVNPLADFHLRATSPCIDAGDNSAPLLPSLDIDGERRIFMGSGMSRSGDLLAGTADMGVDEYFGARLGVVVR
jgi:hypothetical protein